MMGEFGVELLILNDATPEPHWIQAFYFVRGFIVLILGGYFRRDQSTAVVQQRGINHTDYRMK